jgi:glycyl-tRNA synthetase
VPIQQQILGFNWQVLAHQLSSCALAVQVLATELAGLVGSLSFRKSMRWDGHGAAYSRPLRWLLALHGDAPVPFTWGGVASSPSTRLLRNAAAPVQQVALASAYLPLLSEQRITLDFDARRDAIWRDATAAAAQVWCCWFSSARCVCSEH